MNSRPSLLPIRAMSIATLVLLIVSLVPPPAQADNVAFIDATVKKYNDVVFDRFELVEPLILENSFRVMEETVIYLKLTSGGDTNMPIIDDNWKIKFVLRNSTWSFTDFGFCIKDTPTRDIVLSPGEPYTLETKVYYPVHDVRIGEAYEVMVTLVERQAGSYHLSHMLQHLIQFTEEDPLSPKIDFMLIGLVFFAVAIPSVVIMKYWRTDDNDKKKKSKRRRKKKS